MSRWSNIVFICLLCACQRGSESPEDLAQSILSSVGKADKLLSLMPSEKQLENVMTCSEDNALLGLIESQRVQLQDKSNQKAGFRLQFKSAEILKTEKVEKGGAIPFSLSKCKANKPLTFARIKGKSDYLDEKVKMPKDVEFSAVAINGRWLLFLLPSSK